MPTPHALHKQTNYEVFLSLADKHRGVVWSTWLRFTPA